MKIHSSFSRLHHYHHWKATVPRRTTSRNNSLIASREWRSTRDKKVQQQPHSSMHTHHIDIYASAASASRSSAYIQRSLFHTTSYNCGILHHEWIVDGQVLKDNCHADLDEKKTVVFLHGLLGNGKNLRNPAKKLTQQNPNIQALVMDLRGHGNSTNNSKAQFTLPHTIQNCAHDVIETVQHLGLVQDHSPFGIVGHSFGGRCALQYHHILLHRHSTSSTERDSTVEPPQHTWLLDTVPGQAHSSVANVVNAISSIPLPISSKKDLVKILTEEKGIDMAIASWMTTNLKKYSDGNGSGGFEFMFDLDVATSVLQDFNKQPFRDMIQECLLCNEGTSSQGTSSRGRQYLHLVMAGKNSAWTTSIVQDLENMKSNDDGGGNSLNLVTLKNAGHWVHVDDLDGLMKAMKDGFMLKL